MKDFC